MIVGIIALGGVSFYLYKVSNELPQISSLQDYRPPIVSSIYSRDGELLLEVGVEKRKVASFNEIPTRVINCFLAAEDDGFYDHAGVDYMGIFRSMIKNILAGRVVQGGSTITQQVAKTFFTSGERTISRKVKDMLLAKKIEENFSKSEILFLYLNQMYFGGGYHGVKMAASGYFKKELIDVTNAEGAMLAGLLARPHGYSPYISPIYAKRRQRYVLKRLFDTGKISDIEYEEALNEEIKIFPREDSLRKAGYFVDWVKSLLEGKISEDDFMTQGYEIITSLNWKYQQEAEKSVINGLKEIDKREGYKGPIGRVEEEEDLELFFRAQRERRQNRDEKYGRLTPEGELLPINVFNSLEEEEKFFEEKLEVGENLEAIVESTNDETQTIIARVSDNIRVKIEESGFSWAKPRLISEKPTYRPLIKKPSEILKKDDMILVRILSKKKNTEDEHYSFGAELDQEPEVQGALLSVEAQTGEILAMVGGRDYEKSQFNRTIQAERQPGSVFKSFYYAAALEKGYTPATIVMDTPYALSGVSKDSSWKPQNYDKKYLGPITFREALEKSRNIPAIKVAQDVGVSGIKTFVERLGLKISLPNDLSFSLGAFGIKLIDLVKGYSVFANAGKKVPFKSILLVRDTRVENSNFENFHAEEENTEVSDGYIPLEVDTDILVGDFEFYDSSSTHISKISQFYRKTLVGDNVYDERLAYIMTNMLKGVIRSGTGTRARGVSSFIAGKTGTTNDYVDAWFLGYNKEVVTGVWTGFDINRTMGYGEGGGVASLPIWADYMEFVVKDRGESDFKAPDGVINVKVNKETGKLAQIEDQNYFMETFVQGTEPSLEESGLFEDGSSRGTSGSDDDFFLNQ